MARSYLFIPGNNPAMLQNADVFGADALILDLEDAVSPAEKDAARFLLQSFLESRPKGKEKIFIRINGLDTPWAEADLEAVVSERIDGIVLPKAGVEEISRLSVLLHLQETKKGLSGTIGIVPIVELARSVLETDEIAKMPRLCGILLGAEDLTADMDLERTKAGGEIAYPRARVAFACKAFRLEAIDTPFTDTNDDPGLLEDCRKAAALGMDAKAAIHPNQLETIHEVFSPSPKRIEWALRVREASRRAAADRLGVFSLDGKMVDKPVIARAEKILSAARRFGLLPEKDHED